MITQRVVFLALIFSLVNLAPSFAHAQPAMVTCQDNPTDGPAIQAAINSASNNYVQLAAGHHCLWPATGLTFNLNGTGFDGNGDWIDASHLNAGACAFTLSVSPNPANSAAANAQPFRSINMWGYGSTTAICFQAGNMTVSGLNIHNFATALSFGNYAFVDRILDFNLYGNGTAVKTNYGTVDSGENISFSNGTISNNMMAVDNQDAELNFEGVSFDFNTVDFNNENGVVRVNHGHVEGFAQAPVITGNGSCQNAYVHTTIVDTDFLSDGAYSGALVHANNPAGCGSYTQVSRAFLSGFTGTSMVTGAGSSQLCDVTSGAGGGHLDNIAGPC